MIPTRYHHEPEKSPPQYTRHADMVKLADYICQKAELGQSGNWVVHYPDDTRKRLNMSRDDIDSYIEGLKNQKPKIEEFFELIG